MTPKVSQQSLFTLFTVFFSAILQVQVYVLQWPRRQVFNVDILPVVAALVIYDKMYVYPSLYEHIESLQFFHMDHNQTILPAVRFLCVI